MRLALFTLTIGILATLSSCKRIERFDKKVLYRSLQTFIKGYDPVHVSDAYTNREVSKIYEGLFEYHYLKRPYELVPNLAESMPVVSDSGLTYTIKIKKGVFFQDNPCFEGGKGRELKAADFIYSWKRLADPKIQSPGWSSFMHQITGLDEWREENTGKEYVNYDTDVEGLELIDDYTLAIHLTKRSPQILYKFAQAYTYVVPREAVEYYGLDFQMNPVGTGPFTLHTYRRNRMVYRKSPSYRPVFYPTEGAPEDSTNGLLADAGKRLPLIDEVIITVQAESMPAWLMLERGRLDWYAIPKDQYSSVVDSNQNLTQPYIDKGFTLIKNPSLDVTYNAFNNEDPLFSDNVNLRRAISLCYDKETTNELFYNNRVVNAESIIPPGIAGYDPNFRNPYARFDLDSAKHYLALAGYPNGEGLPELNYYTVNSASGRQMSEFMRLALDKIGVKLKINMVSWPELVQLVHGRKAQMYGMGWGADYPDAENFLKLFYSKNISPGPNGSNYINPYFDKLYEEAVIMEHSPERTALYEELTQYIAKQVPVIFGVHRLAFVMKHDWVRNYKFSDFDDGMEKYIDIDLSKKQQTLKKL
jgi:oligopeptide transport system substrate-binding protein